MNKKGGCNFLDVLKSLRVSDLSMSDSCENNISDRAIRDGTIQWCSSYLWN